MTRISLVFIAFSLLLPFAAAMAFQESDTTAINLREVVISENRFKTGFVEQNRSIRLIDRKQIEQLPVRTVNELLGYVAGVDLRQRGAFGSQADVSLDGGSFEQTLILLDGIKLLDAQTAHHALNLPIPLDAIERIEIIRGPVARIYGINSLTGAINIVTRKARKSGFNVHLYGGTGFKTDTANGDALFNGRGIQAGGSLVHRQAGSHSVYGSYDSGNGHRYNTAFENRKVFYKGEIATGEASGFTLMAGYVSSDFGANGFYAAPGDKESREVVGTSLASIAHRARLNENLSLTTRISHRYTRDDYRYFRHNLSRARSQHSGYALAPEINATYRTGIGELGFGLEMRNEKIRSSNIGDHDRNNYGTYIEFRTDQIRNLSINTGAYLNYNSVYGWQVFPGIDLGYRIAQGWKITAHTGTGQRIPSFTDLYLDQRPGNTGNPLVRPEQAWHIEAGIKHIGRRFFAQAHYFYRDIHDFIDWVHPRGGNPPYQPMNVTGNLIHGVSFSADWWLGDPGSSIASAPPAVGQWRISLQYTGLKPSYALDARTIYQSKYSMDILRQQLTGQLYFHNGPFSFSAAGRFQERISYKNYLLGDFRLGYRFSNAIDTYLDIQNIFDTTFTEIAAAPMPGRWVNLGLKYSWQTSR